MSNKRFSKALADLSKLEMRVLDQILVLENWKHSETEQ